MTQTADGLNDAKAAAQPLLDTMRDLERVADGFGTALTRGLKAAVVDGKALDQVLRQVALRLSGQALDAALAPLGAMVSDAVGGLARSIVPFAKGGVVAAPTYFPMAGGRTGLAGEAGAEAILPLARGPDGHLGVRAEGGAVNVTFNVTARDAGSFLKSEAQVTAMLARAVGRGRRGL